MGPFGARVPKWPPPAGGVAMLGAVVISALVPLAAALPAIFTGGERAQPGIVLLGAAGSAAAIVAVVFAIARLTRPVTADQLGLRAPEDLPRSLLLAAAAALVLTGAAAAWALLGDLQGTLVIPPEVDTRSAIARGYGLPVREPVGWGPGLLASALARCVLPVVAGEILLRGFVFPALSSWKGPAGGGPLELVSSQPPAEAQDEGARQGGTGPDAYEPLFELRPAEGDELSYEVTVRNTSSKTVTVTGVVHDEERDGSFVPETVDGAPVEIRDGASAPVTVTGHVESCRFGGQQVPLAGPELKFEDGGSQQFDLGKRIELVTAKC